MNLCEILKGHEGETFYSPTFVNKSVVLLDVDVLYSKITIEINGNKISFNPKYAKNVLFPSKDQRDWGEWIEEQKHKVPKTWSELTEHIQPILYAEISHKNDGNYISVSEDCGNTPIEKSALALLKIHQLIEVEYGGNVTNEEWEDSDPYCIWYNTAYKKFTITKSVLSKGHIAFHSKELAEEFLKYPENVQLLNDYFMI